MTRRLPELPLSSFILLPIWFASVLAVLTAGTILVFSSKSTHGTQASSPKTFLASLYPSMSNYSLFSALPNSGEVLGQSVGTGDGRIIKLGGFLSSVNSPLAPHTKELIGIADKYQLPWALVPAIAGKESGFCRVIPQNSHNCWGWAVYTGQTRGAEFGSFVEGAESVAKGLREDYFNRGYDTVEKIEALYTPQSAKRDNSWKNDVEYFMWAIENWQ